MADLLLLKFDSVHGAQSALTAVRALQDLKYAWVEDIAVVERHKHGHVSLRTPHGSPETGAWTGAIVGMIAFWWFPPAWFLGGAVGGAAVGAGIGEIMKHAGVDERLLDDVKSQLTSGTSALVLIGLEGDIDEITHAFGAYHPVDVIRTPISDKSIELLREKIAN